MFPAHSLKCTVSNGANSYSTSQLILLSVVVESFLSWFCVRVDLALSSSRTKASIIYQFWWPISSTWLLTGHNIARLVDYANAKKQQGAAWNIVRHCSRSGEQDLGNIQTQRQKPNSLHMENRSSRVCPCHGCYDCPCWSAGHVDIWLIRLEGWEWSHGRLQEHVHSHVTRQVLRGFLFPTTVQLLFSLVFSSKYLHWTTSLIVVVSMGRVILIHHMLS